jgi:hypothetical protein
VEGEEGKEPALSADKGDWARSSVLSAYQEKIPARNEIYAHAQDFAAGDVLLQAILKAFIPQPLNKQQRKYFMCSDEFSVI